ncbi:MAG: hypothetical protein Q9212_003215 [Teloschistes hypoglaucus]
MDSAQQKINEDSAWIPSERVQRLREEGERLSEAANEEYEKLKQMEDPMEKAGIPIGQRDTIRQNGVAMVEFYKNATAAMREEIKEKKRELARLKLENHAAMPLPEKTTDQESKTTTEKVTDGSKDTR